MKGAAKTLRDPNEATEEETVVFFSEEARLTIVPALDDVHGKTGNLQAGAARHRDRRISSSIPPPTRDT
ncbi:hypothetical protein D3C83_127440 [compost metagenome]